MLGDSVSEENQLLQEAANHSDSPLLRSASSQFRSPCGTEEKNSVDSSESSKLPAFEPVALIPGLALLFLFSASIIYLLTSPGSSIKCDIGYLPVAG